ncbi:hypothetical protein AVEN_148901-1 [Araneus ventricosus]|uniref:Uncharacterized protein n=1 Tax=Araneus ventricosus TaxID=182803 RepID=A0A4Y2DL06_ARAVE|nr:hypothetical protein AVEN_148901-1 [Araneus ventricosus]
MEVVSFQSHSFNRLDHPSGGQVRWCFRLASIPYGKQYKATSRKGKRPWALFQQAGAQGSEKNFALQIQQTLYPSSPAEDPQDSNSTSYDIRFTNDVLEKRN